MKHNLWMIGLAALLLNGHAWAQEARLKPQGLRTEWRSNPLGIDQPQPQLAWKVDSAERNQAQSAYRLLVASTKEKLAQDEADLWDSGKVASDETLGVRYSGKALRSGAACFWKVMLWDQAGHPTAWSEPAQWTMGLLEPQAWQAEWISHRDRSAVHADRNALYLPPARQYRKSFQADKPIKRATVYASALGIYELQVNGRRASEAYFTPGWSDYKRRAYYNTFDVTALLQAGENCLGAIVADGWYAGYVGYGLSVGYGPNRAGRNFYGKTPALRVQLEIEYTDGTRQIVATDSSWKVSGDGPIREADLIMGETFEARLDQPDWSKPGFDASPWEQAIRAQDNGSTKAVFSDTLGDRSIELGFQAPARLQAYSAPPILVTQELSAQRITEPKPGTYIFDLGQNFAGNIRLKIQGPAGTKVQIRYGEMLHPDGRLMTENLRRARATDYYILRGAPQPETWSPRFTYHGFQFVELTGLPARPAFDAVTGLVLHNDTPLVGAFECSDELMTRFWTNTVWTQRANYVELPTDCPQRDERLGWMGDAQIYVRAATYNADVAAFFTKWLDDVEEAQRSFGAYPDYCPYPMSHGEPRKSFGTAWTDAGIICPWTIWKVYGDTVLLERHWDSFTRFMDFRAATTTPAGLGTSIGNPWGDWLNLGENMPVEFIDTCYHAQDCKLMVEMAQALGRKLETANYRARFNAIQKAFNQAYVNSDGSLKVDTQTAYVLALAFGLLPEKLEQPAADLLANKIIRNGYRMATGFLGTKPLLPVLTAHGHRDLAVRLFQSRQFPSWGYEVLNGANTVWERWDSYTKEDGFGRHNAAMNSFSHYSFGAVTEWIFRDLAGIDTDGPGFKRILIRPSPPAANSNPDQQPINWVKAVYDSPRGKIASAWQQGPDGLELNVTIPANTRATVFLPAPSADRVSESGQPLAQAPGVKFLRMEGACALLEVGSGRYRFRANR